MLEQTQALEWAQVSPLDFVFGLVEVLDKYSGKTQVTHKAQVWTQGYSYT